MIGRTNVWSGPEDSEEEELFSDYRKMRKLLKDNGAVDLFHNEPPCKSFRRMHDEADNCVRGGEACMVHHVAWTCMAELQAAPCIRIQLLSIQCRP